MKNISEWIILILAFVLSFILYISGVRKLPGNWRKKNSFLFSVLLILSFWSCIPAQKAAADQFVIPEDSELDKLFSSREWVNLRNFWKSLNKIETSSSDFMNFMEAEEMDLLFRELEEVKSDLQRLKESNLISDFEIELFTQVCIERIEARSMMLLLTRMVPPLFTMEKQEILVNLEQKIDVLIALKKNDKIDTTEYNAAMNNIKKEIPYIYVLSKIDDFYINRYDRDISVEDMLRILEEELALYKEKKYKKILTENEADLYKLLIERYKITKDILLNLENRMPLIDRMIENLEQ